jgi:hypothetical protein
MGGPEIPLPKFLLEDSLVGVGEEVPEIIFEHI